MKEAGKITFKDRMNMVSAKPLVGAAGSTLRVVGVVIDDENVDKTTGEIKASGFIVTEDGAVYTTISETALMSLRAMADYFNDASELDSLEILVEERKSGGGSNRKYVVLTLV